MRCPSFSNLKSSSTGIPGYGEPPSVKISHIRTPNDHLSTDESKDNIYGQATYYIFWKDVG